jgi:hypothetical protein
MAVTIPLWAFSKRVFKNRIPSVVAQWVWAGEAGDRSLFLTDWRCGGEREVADRIVRQLKVAHIFTD